MKAISLSFFLLFSALIYGQLKPIGSWSDHLPYQSGVSMARNGNQLFCGTQSGVFIFNANDGSITRWSKVNLLSEVSVQKLAYNVLTRTLIVVYNNSNIDLIQNGIVTNIPFLRDYSRVTNKAVNDIFIKGENAYLACGFGVVQLNLSKKEISDSYLFSNNGIEFGVNSVFVDDQEIFAATNLGIYKAALSSNLLDFNNWTLDDFKKGRIARKLFEFNQSGYVVIKNPSNDIDSVFSLNSKQSVAALSGIKYVTHSTSNNQLTYISTNQYSLLDPSFNALNSYTLETFQILSAFTVNKQLFILDNYYPLLLYDENGNRVSQIKPNGPFERKVFDIDALNGEVWAVAGGHNFTYSNTNQSSRIYHLSNNTWTSYLEASTPSIQGTHDMLSVKINPSDENHVLFGSWAFGLFEWKNKLPFKNYNTQNSSLVIRDALSAFDWIGVGEVEFDDDENLWVVNSYTTKSLSVKKTDGSWRSFDFSDSLQSEEIAIKELIVTNDNHKWIALPRLNQILVFNDNETIDNVADDEFLIIRQEEGKGGLPGIRGITFEEDLNGAIWVGTSSGLVVFYSPSTIFDDGITDAERILAERDGVVEEIFAEETINDIEVDGSNRKWIATESKGVFLLSEDGQEEIYHFTTENSPLVSNSVLKVAVDNATGEVYFATGLGIVSFRGSAIEGKDDLSEVVVFPNPVNPGYNGPITISGLMDNTKVKITDVNGRIINELVSKGGQVQWNGKNFENEEIATGIYLVFSSGQDEEENLETEIGKLLYRR
ncbi:MAG: hypothetical protein RIC95_01250 [Vicingaceae bacterium]